METPLATRPVGVHCPAPSPRPVAIPLRPRPVPCPLHAVTCPESIPFCPCLHPTPIQLPAPCPPFQATGHIPPRLRPPCLRPFLDACLTHSPGIMQSCLPPHPTLYDPIPSVFPAAHISSYPGLPCALPALHSQHPCACLSIRTLSLWPPHGPSAHPVPAPSQLPLGSTRTTVPLRNPIFSLLAVNWPAPPHLPFLTLFGAARLY